MEGDPNPLFPATYDLAWALFVVAHVVLVLVAAWQIIRSSRLAGAAKPVWLLVVFLAPIIGPIAWFATAAVERRRASLSSRD